MATLQDVLRKLNTRVTEVAREVETLKERPAYVPSENKDYGFEFDADKFAIRFKMNNGEWGQWVSLLGLLGAGGGGGGVSEADVLLAISNAITAHEAAMDPHSVYLTQAEADALYDALGAAAAAVAAHEAAPNPHPQYLTSFTETDPVFSASPAGSITLSDKANWNTAFGWGNHATAGYLTAETDPVFGASAAAGIAAGDIANWNTAFGWGDHAAAGYVLSVSGTANEIDSTGGQNPVLSLPTNLTFTGKTVTGGVFDDVQRMDFGSVVKATTNDLSSHIALWGTSYGFNITVGALNATVGAGGAFGWNRAGTQLASINTSNQFSVLDGTAALPAYTFLNDPNTGFYRPSADAIYVSLGGTAKMLWGVNSYFFGDNAATSTAVNMNGAVSTFRGGFYMTAASPRWYWGTNAAAESGANAGTSMVMFAYDDAGALIDIPFSIIRAAGGLINLSRPTAIAEIQCGDGTVSDPGFQFFADPNTGMYRVAADTIGFSTAGTHAATIDAAGRLIVGTTAGLSNATGVNALIQSHGLLSSAGAAQHNWGNNNQSAQLNFFKGKSGVIGTVGGGTVGTGSSVANGNNLGPILWHADDGVTTTGIEAVGLRAQCDATPTNAGFVPGRLVVQTCSATAAAATAMVIDSNQNTGIGNLAGAVAAKLHVQAAANGDLVQRISTTTAGDDPTEDTRQHRGLTTNATPTTIAIYTPAASQTVMFEARIVARRTGGTGGTADDGAAYVVRACYKNVGAVPVLIGAVNQDFVAESQAAWDATFVISGANVLLQVTGAANNNITWHATVRQQAVGS